MPGGGASQRSTLAQTQGAAASASGARPSLRSSASLSATKPRPTRYTSPDDARLVQHHVAETDAMDRLVLANMQLVEVLLIPPRCFARRTF